MSRSLPVWIGIGLAAVIAVVAIMWTASAVRHANPEGVAPPQFTMPETPDERAEPGLIPRGLELSGPSVVQNDAEGNAVWSARSGGEFSVNAEQRKLIGTDIEWELARGEQAVSVKAGRMEVGWEAGDVLFDRGVTITAGEGRRFEVAKARYEPGTDKLICEGGVTWKSERFSATAGALVVDKRNNKVRLREGVRITKH